MRSAAFGSFQVKSLLTRRVKVFVTFTSLPFLFRTVTLPLILPGVVAGGLSSFIMSFDNVPVSIFLTRRETITLPVYIMSYLVHNFDPTIAAISAVQVVFTTLVILVVEKFYGIRRLTETI